MPPKVGVGVSCLLLRDDRLLMIQRKGSHGSGMWSVPGGWMEEGEGFGQAASRELWEEMGLQSKVLGMLVHTLDHHPATDDHDPVHDVCFHMAFSDTDSRAASIKEPDKIADYCWASKVTVTSLLGQGKIFLPLQNLLNYYGVIGLWDELRMNYERRSG